MFVDTSVLIAILKRESEALEFGRKLDVSEAIYLSALVQYEAISVAVRLYAGSKERPFKPEHFDRAFNAVTYIIELYDMKVVLIGEKEAKLATQAFKRYGRGSGHRAKLNMGDCFSYACAKARSLPLLFKGNDFTYTDVEQA